MLSIIIAVAEINPISNKTFKKAVCHTHRFPFTFLADTTAFAAGSVALWGGIIRRTKFGRRECHLSENTARIVVLCAYALLVGNTIFSSIDKVLRGSYNSYYRENSERYCEVSFVLRRVAKVARQASRNTLGNVIAATAAATLTAVVMLTHLGIENYRIYRFYNCLLIGMFYAIIKSEKFRR